MYAISIFQRFYKLLQAPVWTLIGRVLLDSCNPIRQLLVQSGSVSRLLRRDLLRVWDADCKVTGWWSHFNFRPFSFHSQIQSVAPFLNLGIGVVVII